jgi:chaperonin GroEL (HSP60 family)
MELSKALRAYARQVGGREQLAIEAFSDALEVIPKSLAENAGQDVLDAMVALKAAHEREDGYPYGVNVFKGGVANMLDEGVVEPMAVKAQAIKSATEVASMILRIDDVIAASSEKEAMPSGEKGERETEKGEE